MVSQSIVPDQFKDRRFFDPSFLAGDNSKLNVFDENACFAFKDKILAKYPELAPAIKAEYADNLSKHSLPTAHLRLLQIDRKLQLHDFNLLSDIGDTSTFAQVKADQCRRLTAKHSHCTKEAYEQCIKLLSLYKIAPPTLDNTNKLEPILNRFSCEKWWKKQLSKFQNEQLENVSRELKLVHTMRSPYCSYLTLTRFKQQKRNNKDYLESQLATNELGQEYSLAQLSELTVSNPAIRRLELITRCKGFEAIADEMGHEGIFITLTTPSRFHRMTKITHQNKTVKVIPNKKFDGSTPRDAQDYLVNLWAKIQAKFSRESIKPYGFRVAEPHHDGTPHWHFLLFVTPEQKQQVKEIFVSWSLLDTPDEKGALENRIKIEDIKKGINPNTGNPYSATGYIIKYICKNIDGFGVNNENTNGLNDWDNRSASTNAEHIEAWARRYRIRQFQQIGGPSVTTWRELRRLGEQEGFIESIRQTADEGDWSGFVKAMGGPNVKRDQQAVRPAYAPSQKLDQSTGEISQVTHTRYGDEAKDRVVGILVTGIVILSRIHLWSIKENDTIISARQKIMDGVVEILNEIKIQNTNEIHAVNTDLLQTTKSAALDLCQ